jgi:catechol 2,3-dioxygenase
MEEKTMPVRSIGHAVLKVRNQARAEEFYNGVLGMPIAARHDSMPMTFFTLGNHHDFAILAVGDDAPLSDSKGVGLFHVAFNVGDNIDDLRAMKEEIEAKGVNVLRTVDHNVSLSLYINDPDGNGIELYVDNGDAWKQEPALVASGKPLAI